MNDEGEELIISFQVFEVQNASHSMVKRYNPCENTFEYVVAILNSIVGTKLDLQWITVLTLIHCRENELRKELRNEHIDFLLNLDLESVVAESKNDVQEVKNDVQEEKNDVEEAENDVLEAKVEKVAMTSFSCSSKTSLQLILDGMLNCWKRS